MIVLKNQTANDIYISGVDTVPASSQLIVDPASYLYLANSNVFQYIWDGSILVNDGTNDISDKNIAQLICLGRITKAEILQNQGQYLKSVNEKGVGSFETMLTHDLTGTPQTFILAPGSGEIYRLEKAEVQFTKDVKMASATNPTQLYFDVWVYNPLVDLGSPIDPDDDTFIPGVSSGNPLRFLYERQIYTSIKDVFNKGNDHFHALHPYDGMVHEISTVQFNYPKWIELKSSLGAQIRVSTKDDLPLEGEFCTISFLVSIENE